MSAFQKGDRVVHPARPEWGEGIVIIAQLASSGGKTAQKLTVDFPNHGRATIHTTHVALQSASSKQNQANPQPKGWLAELEAKREGKTGHALTELPESWSDPFRSRKDRLRDILTSYRFSKEPRSLIDWAIAQTGEQDPMASATRHELEFGFQAWEHARSGLLAGLLREMHRNRERDDIAQAIKDCPHNRARQHVHELLHRL